MAFNIALDSDNLLLLEAEAKQYLLDPYHKNGHFNSKSKSSKVGVSTIELVGKATTSF